jgi:hypothetical protein
MVGSPAGWLLWTGFRKPPSPGRNGKDEETCPTGSVGGGGRVPVRDGAAHPRTGQQRVPGRLRRTVRRSDTDPPVEARSRLLSGSQDLSRTAPGLDRDVSDDVRIGVQRVHLPDGRALANGRKQGVCTAGIGTTDRLRRGAAPHPEREHGRPVGRARSAGVPGEATREGERQAERRAAGSVFAGRRP